MSEIRILKALYNHRMKKILASILICVAAACSTKQDGPNLSELKTEISATEKAFLNAAQTKGAAFAFHAFADSTAVIKRMKDSLIIGKENIKLFYSNTIYRDAKVEWHPDVINVSGSGDMAYSYGKYTWQVKDSSGIYKTHKGVYQTVWKKQKDGTWKYVWD